MLINKRIPEDEFMAMRPEVLSLWPTGKEVDLHEALEYHRSMPDSRILPKKYAEYKKLGKIGVQPRGGTAPLDAQIEMMQYLEKEGADFVPMNLDNYTRALRFEEAQRGLDRSIQSGRPMLNGFPAANYGVKNCRKLIECVEVPVTGRIGDFDCRLVTEIAYAAGFTYSVGGGIGMNLSYNKNIPLERSFACQQYCDRLAAYYEEHRAPMGRQLHMTLTGTLVPHSIAISCLIIEGLMAAEQGVKCLSQQFGLCGCIFQDVAAIKVLREMSQEYLEKMGYHDILQITGVAQWMGAFPTDEDRGFGIISVCAAIAALGGADMVITKSPQEAFGIPTKESNAAGVKATKQVLQMLKDQKMPVIPELRVEMDMMRQQVKCILDRIFEIGNGDVLQGALKAVGMGVIDIPFSPSIYNAGKVVPVRDGSGAIRFLDTGNLPFTSEIKEYNQQEIAKREKRERKTVDWRTVRDDIVAFSV